MSIISHSKLSNRNSLVGGLLEPCNLPDISYLFRRVCHLFSLFPSSSVHFGVRCLRSNYSFDVSSVIVQIRSKANPLTLRVIQFSLIIVCHRNFRSIFGISLHFIYFLLILVFFISAFYINVRFIFAKIMTGIFISFRKRKASSREGFFLISAKPHSFSLSLCSHFIIVRQSLSHFAISSKALDRRNELANVHRHRSALHLRYRRTITSRYVPNTIVHPRASTCKERSIERPRYASASTFVIGSPPSFSFSGRSRAFCAHRLHG